MVPSKLAAGAAAAPSDPGGPEPIPREATHAGRRLDAALLSEVAPPPADGAVLLCCGPPTFNADFITWAAAAGHAEGNMHVF